VDYAPEDDTAPADVRAAILDGYDDGHWAGPGMTSSSAAADRSTALGYARSTELFDFRLDQVYRFFDRILDETSMLVRYTREGDADLDGQVTFTDFLRLRENISSAGDWSDGDFDYDGRVTARDYAMLRRNFGRSVNGVAGALSADELGALDAFAAVVPEPTALGAMLLCGGVALLRRVRRKNLYETRWNYLTTDAVVDNL
jgi:hypothetical protein